MKTTAPSLELLEVRIAPAAVFVDATTATYNDHDGDHVTHGLETGDCGHPLYR
jgi:hypothetical protein